MSLEHTKVVLQQIQNLVTVAQEQLELSEYQRPSTPRKKGGGPFSIGQVVINVDTECPATILRFLGKRKVEVQSLVSGRVYTKHYRWLKAV